MTRNGKKSSVFVYGKFDVDAVCNLATRLRNGIACSCDLYQHPAGGSFNWAVPILFEDGVEWIFRSPRKDDYYHPSELNAKLLASEAATLKYLKLNTDIPVPEVYAYSSTSENDVGIPYILMSKAKGGPLAKVWDNGSRHDSLNPSQKAKVLFQLGHITWKLAHCRFDQVGSLFEVDGTFVMGECLSRGHTEPQRHSLDIPRGPFATEADFYDSLVTAFAQHAEFLPLNPHCFVAPVPSREDYEDDDEWRAACDLWNDFVILGQKIESAENRLDYILVSDIVRDLINQRTSACAQITLPEPFPLYHPDLCANNIFVDADLNITCIIDWGFCSSVPLSILLTPPGLPHSSNALGEDLNDAFKKGYADASKISCPDKTQTFLSTGAIRLLEDSSFYWSLTRLLTLNSLDDFGLFRTLWDTSHGPDRHLDTFIASQRSSSHYIDVYEELQSEDMPADKIEKEERDYFKWNPASLPIARGLTLMSNWGSRYDPHHSQGLRNDKLFVTDVKLWKWLLKYKKQQKPGLPCVESEEARQP